MRFDEPAETNPIDQLKVIGQPLSRIDGPLKTTGRAPYAYERHDVAPNAAYGYVVGSAIAKGRIRSLNVEEVQKASGVLTVVTAENAGALGQGNFNFAKLLCGPEIQHYHQALAVVVAETFEQARSAASLLRIDYGPERGSYDLEEVKDTGRPAQITSGPGDSSVGDFAGAFAAAAMKFDETYRTPDEAHAMMEPHATTAAWDGDRLTVWTSNQMVDWGRSELARTLGMPKENVRLVSPFIGGGFGAKLFLRSDALLAALGARAVQRPVKVALQRALVINNTVHRPATIQRIRIGTTASGEITAIAHESWSGNLPGGKPEAAVQQTRYLYAGEHRLTATRLALLDLPEGNAMRAPGEAPGMMALEVAIDEMAEKLKLDPIEFRLKNDTHYVPDNPVRPVSPDPQSIADREKPEPNKRPFSQRRLAECFRVGAEQFDWQKRSATPRQVREGRWFIGIGTAAAFRNNQLTKSAARVRLDGQGVITVETDMTDIGTGSYTIIAQTAAEMMGVPVEKVVVRLGDSMFPVSAGSGGQWGGNCSTAGVYAACVKLRELLAQKFGANSADVQFTDGLVKAGNRSASLAQLAGDAGVVAEDAIEFANLRDSYQQSTFGAHFVEVGVDVATGETRIRRMLAVCASGRILNPKTARSQVIGAMTMGAGAALMEDLVVDKRFGFFVNHDLASYEVPVHADIPHQDVVFLDETDPVSSPMKAKGLAELGICGVGAAVANAIYNATGVRIRDYPITLDKLLENLPELS
ncbi:xanthine dehydrogenase family protein molybdopterin-binding subunit [Bradyrhizobium sp. LHD-71]|uniref:xanthine dehydrogenase family protein molybdopterin-binding subunit n=1 Tax=Bradyrhizobium sp. LHD-71 TaxID=3072141 RepID=UPI00280CD3A6|nr:xanthine dehydrogenase family protein molybdopterin-binding subunit [Bradyrhizobium sp. LHD-71]MDQ8726629.1 xanthine dehydrogenase family protein molybdopterin-binding subunit [Bradyrhizobium sp. LHD-71]